MVTLEQVLDKLADYLINENAIDTPTVRANQKTIRNGLISIARDNSEKLILFETDREANEEDLLGSQNDLSLQQIVDLINDAGAVIDDVMFHSDFDTGGDIAILVHLEIEFLGNFYTITDIIRNDQNNPINLSQFMNLQQFTQNIDVGLAEEYLDTTIFELLPGTQGRQERIINFFNEFTNLIGQVPDFQIDEDGLVGEEFDPIEYSEFHDISATYTTPDYGIPTEESFITRLNESAQGDDFNEGKTLQSMRDTLNTYLVDVDEELPGQGDERPEYINQSSGYLKFRNLNQGIIIRNTDNPFLDNLNPESREFLDTGFTITMWVRFLDKSSQGTLFNFGNPFREDNPLGFSLETYVIKRDTIPARAGLGFGSTSQNTWGDIFQDGGGVGGYDFEAPSEGFFSEDNAERFVRLVVRENDDRLRGSHFGLPFMNRRPGVPQLGSADFYQDAILEGEEPTAPFDHEFGLMTNTRVPINYSEWYFICATYNPSIAEDTSHQGGTYTTYKNNSDFWKNRVKTDGSYTHYSGLGSRCKVEVISKTDLLRARGFEV